MYGLVPLAKLCKQAQKGNVMASCLHCMRHRNVPWPFSLATCIHLISLLMPFPHSASWASNSGGSWGSDDEEDEDEEDEEDDERIGDDEAFIRSLGLGGNKEGLIGDFSL